MSSLDRALEIARAAHAGQVDKAGRPYIEHVLRIVDAVEGEDAKVVAALHDVLEDAEGWTGLRLKAEGFDVHIVLDVMVLTHSGGNYRSYIACLHGASGRARAVKLADLRDNADPARLALLPERDRVRLSKKYAAAIAMLEPPHAP